MKSVVNAVVTEFIKQKPSPAMGTTSLLQAFKNASNSFHLMGWNEDWFLKLVQFVIFINTSILNIIENKLYSNYYVCVNGMNDKGEILWWREFSIQNDKTYKSGWYSLLVYGGELDSWIYDPLGVDGLNIKDEEDQPSEDWITWVVESLFLCK